MAKSLAIEQARGEWLAFLDCDDLWQPHKLERQVALVSEEGPELGLVYGRMGMLFEEEAKHTPMGRSAVAANCRGSSKALPDGNIFADLLKENLVPQPSAMVRRSAYWSVGGIDLDCAPRTGD
jgi:glycosyltransferase involved in cell wall biosynthesis